MTDENSTRRPGPAFEQAPPEPYVRPERGCITERARARTVPHFQYARAVARKASPRAEKMTDEQLDVDPFVEWVACLFGDFVRKHRDEAQPGEVIEAARGSGTTSLDAARDDAFRRGFNEGHEHGMSDQADHFVDQNEKLRDVAYAAREVLAEEWGSCSDEHFKEHATEKDIALREALQVLDAWNEHERLRNSTPFTSAAKDGR